MGQAASSTPAPTVARTAAELKPMRWSRKMNWLRDAMLRVSVDRAARFTRLHGSKLALEIDLPTLLPSSHEDDREPSEAESRNEPRGVLSARRGGGQVAGPLGRAAHQRAGPRPGRPAVLQPHDVPLSLGRGAAR